MTHFFVLLAVMVLQGILLKSFPGAFVRPEVQLTLNFGFLLLAAYLLGEGSAKMRLPRLTGYLFAGILLGPDIMGYFTRESVESLRFIDDLALTFIALSAGLELRVQDLRRQWRILSGLTLGVPFIVFFSIFFLALPGFSLLEGFSSLPWMQRCLLAALLGVFAIARSPSSTVAVIKECKAKGPFSETVLGVTVGTDILIIVLFTLLLALSDILISHSASHHSALWILLFLEILLSFVLGLFLAWFMAFYIRSVGADRIFFLLCMAFLVTRFSSSLSEFIKNYTGISLHLEPLLICMSAGFFLQNLFHTASSYEKAVDRAGLPIFVVFFALAGTGLDLQSLRSMWVPALALAVLRVAAMVLGSHWMVSVLDKNSRPQGVLYGLSFLTQAGVSIGLASLIPRRFPGEGEVLYTLMLAVIILNQIVGPVAFKFVLERTGEAKTSRQYAPITHSRRD